MGSNALVASQCSIYKNDVLIRTTFSNLVYDDQSSYFHVIIGSDIWTKFKPTQITGLGSSSTGSVFKKYLLNLRVRFHTGDEYSFIYPVGNEELSRQIKDRIQRLVWADAALDEAERLLKTRQRVSVEEICDIFRKYQVASDIDSGRKFIESRISNGFVSGFFDGKGYVSKFTLEREQVRYDIVTNFEVSQSGTIVFKCPNCGAGLPLQTKEANGVCKYCNSTFVVPRKILDMM